MAQTQDMLALDCLIVDKPDLDGLLDLIGAPLESVLQVEVLVLDLVLKSKLGLLPRVLDLPLLLLVLLV